MSKEVPWSLIIYNEFCEQAMLSSFEKELLMTRIHLMPISEQAEHFNCSQSTISRAIKLLKKKYDAVQKHSDILPPRRSSAEETWMDTH